LSHPPRTLTVTNRKEIMKELTTIHKGQHDLIGSQIDGNVKAYIKRNSYDHQSYGVVQAWTSTGWADIQRFPIERFSVSTFSYVTNNDAWRDAMARDLSTLIKSGKKFLIEAARHAA
jgi:hypothetical protein